MKKELIIFSLSLFIACGSKKSHANVKSNNKGINHWIDPNPALSYEINLSIQNQLNAIMSPCPKNGFSEDLNCALVEILPGEAEIKNSSKGYRVLIIDDTSMRIDAYTRYRKRVIKNIIEKENGNFTSENTRIKIPLVAKNILIDTLNSESYEKIPAELLAPAESLFTDKLYSSLEDYTVGHGQGIFNYIANNSPKSQFILAYNNWEENIDSILNTRSSEPVKLKKIDDYFKNKSLNLNYYIRRYKINFISLSAGINESFFDMKNISQFAKNYINKSFYDNFLQNLTKGSDAILVQANGSSSRNFEIDDSGFYSDCAKNTKRIRVGFVRIFDYSIPTFGSRNENYIDDRHKNYIKCTDIYINIPSTLTRPYSFNLGAPYFSSFGLGAEPLVGREISSSNATPIAVAYLLYLRTINPSATNSQLLDQINILKGRKFTVLDPSYHKQLPIYILGYLN